MSVYNPYSAPAGYRDVPYIYVFPAPAFVNQGVTGLASTQVLYNQAIVLNGGECGFNLRRITASAMQMSPLGVQSNAPFGFQLRNSTNANRFSTWRPFPHGIMPIAPEMPYPYASQIGFDINGISQFGWNYQPGGAPTVDSVPLGQLLFEGVRRYSGDPVERHTITQGYKEETYTYLLPVLVNWYYYSDGLTKASGIAPLRRFRINIENGDFDLKSISVLNDSYPTSGGGGFATLYLTDETVENTLLFTAVAPGAGGNSIQVGGLDWATSGPFAPNLPLTINVVGTTITVQLATNGGGNTTTTVPEFVALWNATPAATALASVVGTGVFHVPPYSADPPGPPANVYVKFSGGGVTPGVSHPYQYTAAMIVYDSNVNALMSHPVNVSALNSSAQAIGDLNYGNPVPKGLGAVIPQVTYPNQSLITVDIQSLLTAYEAPTGNQIVLAFSGTRRRAL